MNKSFSLLVALSLAVCACNTGQKTGAETVKDSVVVSIPDSSSSLKIDADIEASFSDMKHFAEYSEDFQRLVASLDGFFRGISLEMTIDEVKKLEKEFDASLDKETASELKYKISLGEGETAIITYTFKDGKVNKINAEVRVNTLELYEALNAELIDYYTKKFGQMQLDGGQEKWAISTTHNLMVHDIMKSKNDFYILVEVK